MANTNNIRRIMRLPEVIKTTGYRRASIYNLMKSGKFPRARSIGARAVGWDSQEIYDWVTERLDAVQ